MLRAAGSQAFMLQRAFGLVILSSIVQGISYALLFPLFRAGLTPEREGLRFYALSLIGLVLLDGLLRLIINRYDWETQIGTGHEVRVKLGEQLRRMPLEYLNSRRVGDLNVVLSGDVNDLVLIMGGLYNVILYTISVPLTTIVITFFIDWRLALLMAVLFPLALPVYQRIRHIAAREKRVIAAAHASVASNLVEYAQGLAVLRATRQIGSQSDRLQEALTDLREKQAQASDWNVVPGLLISSVVQFGILLITAARVAWVLGGSLSVAVLLALTAIMVRFAEPLSLFANMAAMFDFMEAALERIDQLAAVEPLPQLSSQ
ncbi:MAG: ABC transporter ATP-binding protein, partial [Chloroflexota bacterium]